MNTTSNGDATFDQPESFSINKARMEHLESLQLPLEGKTVLDVGCGVGYLAQFFVQKRCEILCIDGRKENIDILRLRYPSLNAKVVNLETDPIQPFGKFQIVFCYGLLYHLDNPYSAIQKLFSVCSNLLLLETIICDYPDPILLMETETADSNQALDGIGCRPSPSYVSLILKRTGFPYVYAPRNLPVHPDFHFERKNNLEWKRDGHNLRSIFVASMTELANNQFKTL